MSENFNEQFDNLFEAHCEELKNSADLNQEQSKTKNLLENFKSYINSKGFDAKAKEQAKKAGIKNYKIIKNAYVSKILGHIANACNIAITITADVVKFASKFITKLICNITNIAQKVCYKIINILTFGCATPQEV